MEIRYHSAVLFVDDIEKAKRFYSTVLGLEIDLDMGSNISYRNGITLWQIRTDHIIPQKIGLERIRIKGNGFELYFETENIQKTIVELKSYQVTFIHEIHEESWGQRTVRIYDPDENIIEIGETLKTFLLRMKNEGLDIAQISAKTGMNKDDILKTINH